MVSEPATGPAPIEAIERALTLLETVAERDGGATLAELATSVGMNKSTAYRALATLRGRGYVTQDTVGAYSLGPSAMKLHMQRNSPTHLRPLLHPALLAVSQATQELTHLGVLIGREVTYLDKVEPARALRVWSAVGRTVPATTSALGRALLAASGITRDQLAPFISDPRHLDSAWQPIVRARRDGFAYEVEENEPGIACVAIALHQGKQPIAAISVTAPAERMTAKRRTEVVGILRCTLPSLLPDGTTIADG